MHLVRAGHRRHIRPPAAYHAVPVAIGGLLGAFSPRLYGWLLAHPCFGEYVRNFRENRAIPLRAKIISLTLMWGTMLYCIFALLTAWWWAQAALLAVAIGVTWHILSFATLKKGVRCRKTPKGNNLRRKGWQRPGGGAPRGETVCLP